MQLGRLNHRARWAHEEEGEEEEEELKVKEIYH